MLLLALALFVIGHNLYVTAAKTERINGISENTFAAEDVNSVDYDVVIPEACKGLNYCMIKPDDSPQDEINNFFEYEEMLLHKTASIDDILRRKRMLSGDELIPPCISEIKYEKMYAVKEIDKWYIATQNHYYHIEECLNPGASCNENLETSNEWKTICKQKMRTVQVQVVTNKGEKEIVNTSLPNGCSCEIKLNK